MSDVYEEILNSSNINNILDYYGIKVNKNKCLCPFHHDSHPSMSVHPSKGIVKCFACGAGGNSISFVQKYENDINHNPINIRDAMQKVIDIQGLNISIPNNTSVSYSQEEKEKNKLNSILKDAIQLSEKNLNMKNNLDSQKVVQYLKNRNLSMQIINNFHIGFNPSYNNLTNNLLKKYSKNELIDVGITKETQSDFIDVFSNRITIPIFDANGNPVGFGARTLDDNVKPKYINTKETTLFNKSEILFNYHKAKYYARNDEIIIVEGYMDVISSNAMKMDNVVGLMGTAFTEQQIELVKKLNAEVTLCLDNDEAGRDAMIRIIPELMKQNLKVNVLDISKLGNYKDFGDLQIANLNKEQVYKTKISAFTFLLQYKYLKDMELTVENINSIYNKMCKDGLIKTSKDVLNFKEYVLNNTSYSADEIEKIINPTEIQIVNNRVDRYKDAFFYSYVINLIKNYATKHGHTVLLKYIESGKLTKEILTETLNNEEYLKDNELSIYIGSYIRDYLLKSKEYIDFKNDKAFILENLLDNVKSYDSDGNIVDIVLTSEQKEMIINQYKDSFDESIREYIENNPDEFEEVFIANNNNQFEKLFPKSYSEAFKEQAMSRFRNDGVMEVVRYGLAFSEEMKSALSRQFVNNGKFKSLLVFNNNKNILGLSSENIKKEETKTIEKEKEIVKDEVNIEKTRKNYRKPVSIFINLSGKEKETSKGIYIPIDSKMQVYIPKELYKRKENSKLELLVDNYKKADMSEYSVNQELNIKKWNAKLTVQDFFKKYNSLYEVKMEKEVMA